MIRLLLVSAMVAVSLADTTTSRPQNGTLTCRSEPRAKCFAGTCPQNFTCISTGMCCDNNDVVKPAAECSDFISGCESIQCAHRDFYEFARANCARTCNYCDDKPLAPEYNCNDILPDCKDRAGLCRDRDFYSMMALYCPRTCALCAYSDTYECADSLNDCATRGQNFCDNIMTSLYQKSAGCGKTCKMC